MTPIAPRKQAAKKAAAKKPAPSVTKSKPKAAAKKPAAQTSVVKKKAAAPAPKSPSKKSPTAQLCDKIAAILDTNKAEQIITLPLIGQCSFADYMIVASGRAPRHVSALADYVADHLKKTGNPPLSIEGQETGDWVLIDAGDVVVHIFRPEIRQFYNIEKMWSVPQASAR